jgi:hypothetical protein
MKKDFSGSHSKEKLRSITFNEEGNLYQRNKWMGDKLVHDGYQFSNGYLAVFISANGKRKLFVLDRNHNINIDIKIDKETYKKLKDLIDDFRAEAEIYEYYERKYEYYKWEHRESNHNQRTYQGTEKPKTSGNPKLDKLEEKIKLREEQLAKIPRNRLMGMRSRIDVNIFRPSSSKMWAGAILPSAAWPRNPAKRVVKKMITSAPSTIAEKRRNSRVT